MIDIIINNEYLDMDASTLVTFKKSQQLNGLQDQYAFSNNFNLKNSSKNRRLLGINYLPNSKAKSMTAGYDVDVVLNGCIFLKRQKLKVQKETAKGIPVYLIFSDNLFAQKAQSTLLNQIDLGIAPYPKTRGSFVSRNTSPTTGRTAPVSAQDQSGLIVVQEIPIFVNLKDLVLRIFAQLGYVYIGDILTDEYIGEYYISANVGEYGTMNPPIFDETLTVWGFLQSFLKTFNGYIEVSDSSKAIGLFFWKNIETLKSQFKDYSSKFVDFTEYTFEGGLAKTNTLTYADSPSYYNSFFNNNKSILETAEYLSSDFGAGSLRLFDDQDVNEDGTIDIRETGEKTDSQTINIFRFESTLSTIGCYSFGVKLHVSMYKAFSPNILEIWERYHQQYCKNIALPTTALLKFRYDAIFLANFKMNEVFFIRQLSTYWLPLELNFTTAKDKVAVKCLMIERTPADIPIVFDLNVSIGFYEEIIIDNIDALYSAQNTSPPQTFIVTDANLAKNDIFINGVQVLAFPTSFDVSEVAEIRIANIDPVNRVDNSDILFVFISEQGGRSRVGKINVAHNGRANFVSEFRSEVGTLFSYGLQNYPVFWKHLNFSAKVTTPINIPDTTAPSIGSVDTIPEMLTAFKVLQFSRASTVTAKLNVEYLEVYCSNRGGGAEARTRVYFKIYKNGVEFHTIATASAIADYRSTSVVKTWNNIAVEKTFNVSAGDTLAIEAYITGSEENRNFSGTMNGSASMRNVVWKFLVSEQL